MNKQEFEKLIDGEVNDKHWEMVEFVYTWHPSISNVNGKKEIADLYKMMGIRIITDMYKTAERAKSIEDSILYEKRKVELHTKNIEALQKSLEDLKNCNYDDEDDDNWQ